MKNANFTPAIVLSIGGLLGGIFTFFIETKIFQYIGEYQDIRLDYLLALGLLTGITFYFITIGSRYIITSNKIKRIRYLYSILLILILIGLFSSLYFIGENTTFSWLLLVLSFAIWIYIGYDFFYSIGKGSTSKHVMSIIGACIGGLTAGFFISLAFVLRINFSIDEGYFILTYFLLSLIGATIGVIIVALVTSWNLAFKNKANLFSENSFVSKREKIVPVLLVIILLFPLTAFNYWDTMGLNEISKLQSEGCSEDIFICSNLNSENEISSSTYNKSEIIEFLENKPDKEIDTFAVLYLLSNDSEQADNFKISLLEEASKNKFIGISGSVKAWQYEAMVYAYYYLLVTDKNPNLFNETENELILNWFKEINIQAFKVGWADYVYGFIFKKMPDGPYENQEIGAGLLAVLSEVLKEKYPELSQKDIKYIDKLGIGWKYNFRNPDDEIVYAQTVWMKNAYMMAKYGGQDDYMLSNNSRNSFEWILLQWPPNGLSPAYNVPNDYTPFDVMTLGAHLFHDGRYLWLSEKMISDETKNKSRITDHIIGLEHWNDNLTPVKPTVGSCYIFGTTGIAQKRGVLKPDKIVFRDGWNNDSLYTLLNLRFSGWHSYKATNCIISVMQGEPFVVEKLELKQHRWLPKGKADHRDKKILREELNGFQIEKTGLEKIIYGITGFGSPWAQDPPRFAEVITFNSTPMADYAITKISDWHGWEHQRASVLVKDEDGFLVVFDYAKGESPNKVGITWHLKGDAELREESVKLSQNNSSLTIFYPHSKDCYEAEIVENKGFVSLTPIHDPEFDLWMISENRYKINFITLFYPEQKNNNIKIEKIDVVNEENYSSYPSVAGIKIIEPTQEFIIGSNFGNGVHTYENIKTDANLFISQKTNNIWRITFNGSSFFEINLTAHPPVIRLDNKKLVYDEDFFIQNDTIMIKCLPSHYNIEIEYEER